MTMSIEINDRDVRMTVTNHSELASWKKVRIELGSVDVGDGNTNFVREVTKGEHADDCSGERDGSQGGGVVVIIDPLSVDSSQH